MLSAPVSRLAFHTNQVEAEFEKWQRERTTSARKAFDEMMSENAFVEFWGRLGKIGGQTVSDGLKLDGEDIGEAGEEEEKVDMKSLAKTVDLKEMEKVLKVCPLMLLPYAKRILMVRSRTTNDISCSITYLIKEKDGFEYVHNILIWA